jgi:hypothetical protein
MKFVDGTRNKRKALPSLVTVHWAQADITLHQIINLFRRRYHLVASQ